ncbi:B- and T-lymphocyte attenuator isoform X2 [Gouania willdenowi]|uniref:B- and T-lymphocyte attenuator isoform X2 n=1 Tax=Gouania willdenowi TaxID=441366 RepID=UPI001054A1A1|nr:B- and T-lymphocyte attenuator-like isoform X2 [Gouania willdenowi]
MRPKHGWALVHVSILAGLLLTCNTEATDSEDSSCSQRITVRRHTVYKATVGQTLKINCTVFFCDDTPPTVSWEKNSFLIPVNKTSHINTEWSLINKQEGVSLLSFKKIHLSDSGRYNCQMKGSVSHGITLNVYGDNETISPLENSTSKDSGSKVYMTYVYSAVGTASVVIAVIIVTAVLLRGCKGRSKKENKTENQYICMEERTFTHRTPKGSPSVTPSTQKKTTLMPPKREIVSTHKAQMREENMTQKEEEGASIVYAAINHQLPSTAAGPRRQTPQEEPTLYAALRVA